MRKLIRRRKCGEPRRAPIRLGHKSGVPQVLLGNLDLRHGHISTEGLIAFNSDECHADSLRGIHEIRLRVPAQ